MICNDTLFEAGQKWQIWLKKWPNIIEEEILTIDSVEGEHFFVSLSNGGSGLGIHKSVIFQVLVLDNDGQLIVE